MQILIHDIFGIIKVLKLRQYTGLLRFISL